MLDFWQFFLATIAYRILDFMYSGMAVGIFIGMVYGSNDLDIRHTYLLREMYNSLCDV